MASVVDLHIPDKRRTSDRLTKSSAHCTHISAPKCSPLYLMTVNVYATKMLMALYFKLSAGGDFYRSQIIDQTR